MVGVILGGPEPRYSVYLAEIQEGYPGLRRLDVYLNVAVSIDEEVRSCCQGDDVQLQVAGSGGRYKISGAERYKISALDPTRVRLMRGM